MFKRKTMLHYCYNNHSHRIYNNIFQSIRFMNVWPLGPILRKSYSVFRDNQDQGDILLTPLYLLVGMSLPLWICKTDLIQGKVS